MGTDCFQLAHFSVDGFENSFTFHLMIIIKSDVLTMGQNCAIRFISIVICCNIMIIEKKKTKNHKQLYVSVHAFGICNQLHLKHISFPC